MAGREGARAARRPTRHPGLAATALGLAGHDRGAGGRPPGSEGGGVGAQLLYAVGAGQHTIGADRGRATRGHALAPGVRRKSAAGLHCHTGRRVPFRPVAGTPAAPVREPGLFDDLHRGQSPAVMVRARRMRQPGRRCPAPPGWSMLQALSPSCRASPGTWSARWPPPGPPPVAQKRRRCGRRPAAAR